jgi:hypothetical protein
MQRSHLVIVQTRPSSPLQGRLRRIRRERKKGRPDFYSKIWRRVRLTWGLGLGLGLGLGNRAADAMR